jgi:hypothetical protein
VLDDVQRRRFLVQPAREDPCPFAVGALDVDLDEGAGQLFRFPRRGRFARTKPHGDVLPTRRLARVERDVADDPVAFVEDGEDGDPLGHWRHACLARDCPRALSPRRLVLLRSALARRERACGQQCRGDETHVYSGIQGS